VIAATYNQQRHAGGYLRGVYTERAGARTTMRKRTEKRRSYLERFDELWSADPNTGCVLWTGPRNEQGYGRIWNGERRILTHREVWERAHGTIRDGLFVLHSCDCPPCGRLDHLFLGTHADNAADRNAKGRQARQWGETNGRASVDEVTVMDIRRAYARGGVTQDELAQQFGVGKNVVTNAVNGMTWIHLPVIDCERAKRENAANVKVTSRGEDRGHAKLTDMVVREIRAAHAGGTSTQRALAARFGVCGATISKVVRRIIWTHVDP
jgi:hypothetical protein